MFDVYESVRKIGGWLSEAEANFLYEEARHAPKGSNIAEIGSWKGKSTICLGLGSKHGNRAKIYAIDPHSGSAEHIRKLGKVDTYETFLKNIRKAEVHDLIEPIREMSLDAAEKFNMNAHFVFIDGDHQYSSVKADFKAWFSRLDDGGRMAFHDTWNFLGPSLATALPLFLSGKIRNPKLIDTITVFDKVSLITLRDRLKNICFVIYRLIAGLFGFLRLRRASKY